VRVMSSISKKEMHPRAGHYRVSDIAKRTDRTPTTILRWEKAELIPRAKRDSRGWRMYTKDDVESIVGLIQRTHYFENSETK